MKTISILLPSRGRPEGIERFINSTINHCRRKQNVEVLIKLDSDDFSSIEYCIKHIRKDITIKTVISPRSPGGYYDVHVYYNELIPLSTGTFIAFMTDDVFCKTVDWDSVVEEHINNKYSILWTLNENQGKGITPIVHRHLVELSGNDSGECTDLFWYYVSIHAKISPIELNVIFRHERDFPPSWKLDGLVWDNTHYPNLHVNAKRVGQLILKERLNG